MSQTIAFIPARAGSTRIPDKNLARGPLVGDATLLHRAIVGAQAACDRVVVSTNDAASLGYARAMGCEVHKRPDELSDAHAQIEDAIAHWLAWSAVVAKEDVIVIAQPTSPFRRPETIRQCVDLVRRGCDSALTVALNVQNHGRIRGLYDAITGDDIARRTIWNRPIGQRPRSQDAVPMALENGVAWAFSVAHFRKTGLRMGGREASVPTSWLEALEVDTPQDLEVARVLAPHVERLIAMEGT